jgi:hypothetical protein
MRLHRHRFETLRFCSRADAYPLAVLTAFYQGIAVNPPKPAYSIAYAPLAEGSLGAIWLRVIRLIVKSVSAQDEW